MPILRRFHASAGKSHQFRVERFVIVLFCGESGTFGGRWDDPSMLNRIL